MPGIIPALSEIMEDFKKSFSKDDKYALNWVFKDKQELTGSPSQEGQGRKGILGTGTDLLKYGIGFSTRK